MDVNATLREIGGIKDEVLGPHEEYQSRRRAYKKTLNEVKRTYGTEASHDLDDWIKTQIQEQRKLPKGWRVRQQGADICRERGHTSVRLDRSWSPLSGLRLSFPSVLFRPSSRY